MKFISTRGKEVVSSASEAIVEGLAKDGGLFVPEYFPKISESELSGLLEKDYAERASFVMGKFLTEINAEELLNACKKAYSSFDEGDASPVVKIDDDLFILELFHGPTLAFKDIALTVLPYLLRKGADKTGLKETILILVATSGDTGKAALSGFSGQDGIKICVFYPSDGVSDMQKFQMQTQEGDNVYVVAVKGNFDDCQTTVKKIFGDEKYNKILKDNNVVLSSANSINFGRLVPQVSYYFSSYLDLVDSGEIKLGDKVNFVVPTGNFGNILAGYYAKQMGLPIGKLICASNSNNVLTEFILTGNYDKNREFFKTTSPSMDILVSSNLERLIFELSNRDAAITRDRMEDLKNIGKYQISKDELNRLKKDFCADYADEEESSQTIADFFDEYGYVLDPHTAVAIKAYNTFKNGEPTVVLSTASAYKFPQSVVKSLTGKTVKDAFKASENLFNLTASPIPEQITKLKEKPIRFTKVIEKEDAKEAVLDFINGKI